MRRMMQTVVVGCAILLAGAAARVEAEILTLEPVQAAVVTAQEVEDTRVVLRFDLSGLPGARVDLALLEWPVVGMASDGLTEYCLVEVTGSWTEAGMAAGGTPALAEEDAGWWEFSPLDYERNDGGLIRFDVTALVSDWVSGEAANHGVAIVTTDLGRQTVVGQLQNAKLIVTYLP